MYNDAAAFALPLIRVEGDDSTTKSLKATSPVPHGAAG